MQQLHGLAKVTDTKKIVAIGFDLLRNLLTAHELIQNVIAVTAIRSCESVQLKHVIRPQCVKTITAL
jgi:hypothetical protein